MALDRQKIDALLKRLDEQRDAYLESHSLVRQLFEEGGEPSQTSQSPPGSTQSDAQSGKPQTTINTLLASSTSRGTGEDSDDNESGEDFYAQVPLEHQEYDHEGLRSHLRSYKWPSESSKVVASIIGDPTFLSRPTLFPTASGPVPDRSHYSHYQVFDVGSDGAPLAVILADQDLPPSNALCIWHTIKELNPPAKERKAVGRISIMRELSPVLFGAIHYTMHRYFDVDELFRHLVQTDGSSASLHRVYDSDERRRRSFVFNFEYFTLIGNKCQPMAWQLADRQEERSEHHIAITRCSSVVALHLGGKHIKRLKDRSRQAKGSYGFVYDPFASWQVLNLQCYPDWKASLDVHDSTKHYANGVEAFIVTILGEFNDAELRFREIYNKITKLITPPLNFMFNEDVRRKLLFEDASFTLTRRYFWAAQTLAIVSESIKAMINAYEHNFTEEVWLGGHKTLWLLEEENSPRNLYFRKKMAVLRRKFDRQMQTLRKLIGEIDTRRKEIETLREELFVGTSIQESRKSVENSEITVQQGQNIKILTMVSIFFLPLTFVTSVFGMTNMPTEERYWNFGIVTACVCVPFFVLIGSLNSNRGMHFWHRKTQAAFRMIGELLAWVGRGGGGPKSDALHDQDGEGSNNLRTRTMSRSTSSTQDAQVARLQMRPSPLHVSSNDVVGREPAAGQNAAARNQDSADTPSRLVDMIHNEFGRRRTLEYTLQSPRDTV